MAEGSSEALGFPQAAVSSWAVHWLHGDAGHGGKPEEGEKLLGPGLVSD